jgi:hypothetical protein
MNHEIVAGCDSAYVFPSPPALLGCGRAPRLCASKAHIYTHGVRNMQGGVASEANPERPHRHVADGAACSDPEITGTRM